MRRVTPAHSTNLRPVSETAAKQVDRRSRAVARAREQYFAAWRWRRAVERELRDVGLTLTQWLVLDAADELIHEEGDAVNQRRIAERAELDVMTVSQVMKTLEEKALVSREPDVSGRAYRVFVTKKGERLLQTAAPRVEMGTRA
jgi:DNA-binding MarR family transcriptional regulator